MRDYNEFNALSQRFVAEVGAPPLKLTHGTVSTISGPGVTSVNPYPFTGMIVVGNDNAIPMRPKPARARFTPPTSLCSAVHLGFLGGSLHGDVKIRFYDAADQLLEEYRTPGLLDFEYKAQDGKTIKYVEVDVIDICVVITTLIFWS